MAILMLLLPKNRMLLVIIRMGGRCFSPDGNAYASAAEKKDAAADQKNGRPLVFPGVGIPAHPGCPPTWADGLQQLMLQKINIECLHFLWKAWLPNKNSYVIYSLIESKNNLISVIHNCKVGWILSPLCQFMQTKYHSIFFNTPYFASCPSPSLISYFHIDIE